jgi:hypothetical protein
MSLSSAKRLLQWNAIHEAMEAAGLDAETVKLVEQARAISETIMVLTDTLTGSADIKQAQNYVKVEIGGLLPPFERAYVELVRPGGKTSHELREMLRDRLTGIRGLLAEGQPHHWTVEGMIHGIDEDLAKEAP